MFGDALSDGWVCVAYVTDVIDAVEIVSPFGIDEELALAP